MFHTRTPVLQLSTAYINLYGPFFKNTQNVCAGHVCVCILGTRPWNHFYLSLLNLRECRMAGRLWRRFHKCSVSSAQAATRAPCGEGILAVVIISASHFTGEKIGLNQVWFVSDLMFWCPSFIRFWSFFRVTHFRSSPKRNLIIGN